MKPKPFSALNHLTVPCAMTVLLLNEYQFQKFHITNTLAVHNDTDTVSLALKDGAQPARVLIKHLGDVSNGDHLVQLKIGPVVFQGTNR